MQFMYGRYATRGPDALYKGTLIFYLVLFVVNLFIKNKTASRTISALMVLLIVWLIFRMLSKNHVARMKEQAEVLISELIARVGRDTTMIITGDMNSKLDSAAIQYMINNETMPLTSVDLMASESYRNDAVGFGIIQ